MALGIVDDKTFEEELKKIDSKTNDKNNNKSKTINIDNNKTISNSNCAARIIDITKSGRNSGDNNVPEELRNVIAEERINGADVNEITSAFPISPSSIHAYSNGATSTAHDNSSDDKLNTFVNKVRTKITKKASRTLIRAIDAISDDKMDELKANEISSIARNMSAIIRDIQPQKDIDTSTRVQFNIYAPPQKTIDKYEVIEVKS